MTTEYIIANWKMNGNLELINDFSQKFSNLTIPQNKQIIMAPNFLHMSAFIEKCSNRAISFAGQNCSNFPNGAKTGDTSAQMLKEIGCDFVIIGHSERRELINEENLLKDKISQALSNNLKVIFCVGESEEDKNNDFSASKILQQLAIIDEISEINSDNFYIAYEPVWAIGSSKIPTNQEISKIALLIQNHLQKNKKGKNLENHFKILYGGSVNSNNIANLRQIKEISGFLVGGASLKTEQFLSLI